MNTHFFGFEGHHHLGDSATHSTEPLATHLGSLLLLAGSSLQRRRVYPNVPPAAHSDASN
ncbi:MAG: hypothetical protein K9K38_04435 [Rhodoferax sp.]|nr:hypothetical protein [Rhodoferax sp.]